MKKVFAYIILMLLSIAMIGCDDEIGEFSTYTIFSLNDFHGSVINDQGGLSVIGNYLIKEKEKDPKHTLIISSGDMFQGSALSNMTMGGVVVEIMNEIGFDSMTIGNHEFDWGSDIIAKYNSDKMDVKAKFPLICANIYNKATSEPVDWCEPYTIIERGNLKIGIIGVIGSSLTSSIATKFIEPYEFRYIVPIVKTYAKELRNVKNCDIVLLAAHDDTVSMNQQIADLSGDEKIDAVFNAHTHLQYAGETMRQDGDYLPYLQSGSSGSHIGKITLKYNNNLKKVIEVSAENIKVSKNLISSNSEIDNIIDKFNAEVSIVSDEVLGIAGTNVSRMDGAKWAANVIYTYSDMEIGMVNYGGIRANAFPINKGDSITVGRMWLLMPFDNFVKTCELTVSDAIKACNGSDIIYSGNVTITNNSLYINGVEKNSAELVKVATIDYVFDKSTYPFLKGQNQTETGILFRDYLIQAVRDACQNDEQWTPNI